jgi:hypothetical protein
MGKSTSQYLNTYKKTHHLCFYLILLMRYVKICLCGGHLGIMQIRPCSHTYILLYFFLLISICFWTCSVKIISVAICGGLTPFWPKMTGLQESICPGTGSGNELYIHLLYSRVQISISECWLVTNLASVSI